MLKSAVTPIHNSDVPDEGSFQALEWVLTIIKSSEYESVIQHPARFVSAAQKALLHDSVHGNISMIKLSILGIIISLLPTWTLQSKDDQLVIFTRDVIKGSSRVT